MAKHKPIPVDWKTLCARVTAYQECVCEETNLRKLFLTILDDGCCDPSPIFKHVFPIVEQAILEGRTQDALEQFAILAIDLCARVNVMASVMPSLKRMVGHSARIKEAIPIAQKRHHDKTQTRYKKIAAAVEKEMKRNWPHNSLTYARKSVSDSKNISLGTVKTATKGMKGPPRKMKK